VYHIRLLYPDPPHFLQKRSPAPLHATHSRFPTAWPRGSRLEPDAAGARLGSRPTMEPDPSQAKHLTPPLPAQDSQISASPLKPLTMAAEAAATTAPPTRTSCRAEGSTAAQTWLARRLAGTPLGPAPRGGARAGAMCGANGLPVEDGAQPDIIQCLFVRISFQNCGRNVPMEWCTAPCLKVWALLHFTSRKDRCDFHVYCTVNSSTKAIFICLCTA
jgi:hypothetical protein